MALDTYDGLVEAVSGWLFNRQDLADRIPDFIRLTEAKLNRTLFTRQMESRAYTDVLEDADEPQYVSLPSDFQTMRTVRLTTEGEAAGERLKFLASGQLDDERYRNPNRSGGPVWFTIFGDEMEIFPAPSYPQRIEMVYRTKLLALSEDNQSNWLLEDAPDAYLYGALLEAAPYLHEDERIAIWDAGFQRAVSELNTLSEQATYNAGPLSMGRKRRGY